MTARSSFGVQAFARAYTLALSKLPPADASGAREFAGLVRGVMDELQLHQRYAEKWGVDMSTVVPVATTQAYVDFLGKVASEADVVACAAAMVPCMRLYAHLGQRLAQADTSPPGQPAAGPCKRRTSSLRVACEGHARGMRVACEWHASGLRIPCEWQVTAQRCNISTTQHTHRGELARPDQEWIDTYNDPDFEALAASLEQLLDRYAGRLDGGYQGRYEEIRRLYVTAMELELAFFAAWAPAEASTKLEL